MPLQSHCSLKNFRQNTSGYRFSSRSENLTENLYHYIWQHQTMKQANSFLVTPEMANFLLLKKHYNSLFTISYFFREMTAGQFFSSADCCTASNCKQIIWASEVNLMTIYSKLWISFRFQSFSRKNSSKHNIQRLKTGARWLPRQVHLETNVVCAVCTVAQRPASASGDDSMKQDF